MRNPLVAIAALVLIGAPPGLAQTVPAAPTPPSSSLAGARPETDLKLDSSRRPADLLAFAQIRTGAVVMDVWPGRGYWTRLFSTAVGPTGKVYAYVPTEITAFKPNPLVTIKAVAAEPGRDNVVVVSDPAAEQPPPAFQNVLDVVFTFENYHDLHDSFMKGLDVDAFNRAVFLLLKPGGAYVIVDHAALAGTGLKNTEDLHRIDPAALRAEVEKAGFKFDGESTVLANPDDPKSKVVFDTSIRGKTDRFAYRFVKPRP